MRIRMVGPSHSSQSRQSGHPCGPVPDPQIGTFASGGSHTLGQPGARLHPVRTTGDPLTHLWLRGRYLPHRVMAGSACRPYLNQPSSTPQTKDRTQCVSTSLSPPLSRHSQFRPPPWRAPGPSYGNSGLGGASGKGTAGHPLHRFVRRSALRARQLHRRAPGEDRAADPGELHLHEHERPPAHDLVARSGLHCSGLPWSSDFNGCSGVDVQRYRHGLRDGMSYSAVAIY